MLSASKSRQEDVFWLQKVGVNKDVKHVKLKIGKHVEK